MQTVVVKLTDGGTLFRVLGEGEDVGTILGLLINTAGNENPVIASGIFDDAEVAKDGFIDSLTVSGDALASHDTIITATKNALAATDAKTTSLIARGIQYAGKIFSLSLTAQLRFEAVRARASDPSIFPIDWSNIDNSDQATIAQADFLAFSDAAFDQVRTLVLGGNAVKASIRAASTMNEIVAALATDTRVVAW